MRELAVNLGGASTHKEKKNRFFIRQIGRTLGGTAEVDRSKRKANKQGSR